MVFTKQLEESDFDDDQASSSLNLNPMQFTNMLKKSQNENSAFEGNNIQTCTAENTNKKDSEDEMRRALMMNDTESDSDDEGQLKIDENATNEDEVNLAFENTTNVHENETIRRSTRKRSLSSHFDSPKDEATASKMAKHQSNSNQKAATRSRKQMNTGE